jgi:hypothetical protein
MLKPLSITLEDQIFRLRKSNVIMSGVKIYFYTITYVISLVAWWSELLTTKYKVPGSIPGTGVGIFPYRGRSPQRPWSG